ncbi:hypothetical protein OM392_14490 [Serratia bockelmannii]|uniref:hypothetical protein n=1 Tax=Serratia bockelmannii TaxID=2703793 RepID=UPI0022401EF6|nr:hypothetical protein [Serratia bockelmannii]MCW7609083.1 hypothetical protein [Serratia bockelmannii]
MEKMLLASVCIAIGVPLFIAIMSFITWQNGFKMLGAGYLSRLTAVLIAFVWVYYAILKIKGDS